MTGIFFTSPQELAPLLEGTAKTCPCLDFLACAGQKMDAVSPVSPCGGRRIRDLSLDCENYESLLELLGFYFSLDIMLNRAEEGHMMYPMRTDTPGHLIRGFLAHRRAMLLHMAHLVVGITFLPSHYRAEEFCGNATSQPQKSAKT